MRKVFILTTLALLVLTVSAGALDLTIQAPGSPEYGEPTSIEVVHTASNGEQANEDVSKNAALIPPGFGTPTADLPGSGSPLTPDLAPGYQPAAGAVISGSSAPVQPPIMSGESDSGLTPSGGSGHQPGSAAVTVSTTHTAVTDDLYYRDGRLGRLEIPALDLDVKIYQGTDSAVLARGVGHFEDTSIWGGNVALAAHNRGANAYFGKIHSLEDGDRIVLTTKLGSRTYAVTSVAKVRETDRSGLAETGESCLTLYTCVRDQRDWRWCVRAVEVL